MKSIFKLALLLLVHFSLLFYLQSCNDEEGEDDMTPSDVVAPTILTFSPVNGAADIPVNTDIIITFSEPIDLGSIDNSSLRLTAEGSNLPIGGNISVSGNIITLTPTQELAFETRYTITVSATVSDLAGNNLAAGINSFFVTAIEPDVIAPTVISIAPENESVDVPIDANIVITFSEPIDLNSVNDESIILRTPAFSNNIQAEVNIDGNIMTIDPTVDFEGDSEYTLTLGVGLMDLAGNALEEESITTFNTVVVDNDPPTIPSIVPANESEEVATDANIIVTFSEAIDESSINDESVSLTIVNGSDNLAIEITIDDNIMTINPAVDFEEGTEYLLTLASSISDLAGNELGEVVESSFRTLITDTTGPNIVSYSIANVQRNVPVDASITVTFDEPIDEGSLVNNLQIRLGGTTNNFIDLSFEVDGNDVIVTPTETLAGNTEYVMNVTTGITDLAGNRLRFQGSRVFTTAPNSLEIISITPSNLQQGVEIEDDISVTFSSDIDPSTATNFNFQLQELAGNIGVPLNGFVEVNGATVSFVPSEPLIEFQTNYRLVIRSRLQDIFGNSIENDMVVEFTTVQFSELYGYFIRNNSDPNNNTLRYDENSNSVISARFLQSFTPQIWRFTNEGNGLFSISNRALGNNEVLTTISRNVFELAFTSRMATPSSGQLWRLTDNEPESASRFIISSLIFGPNQNSYLDGATLNIINGNIQDDNDTWIISRAGRLE